MDFEGLVREWFDMFDIGHGDLALSEASQIDSTQA